MMSITISPEMEAKLREKADYEGCDINSMTDSLLNMALKLQAQEQAETIEAIKRGLADHEAGRVSPANEVLARLRATIESHR